LAWLFGEKKFGQYTYEHWFDDEIDVKPESSVQKETEIGKTEKPQTTEISGIKLTEN